MKTTIIFLLALCPILAYSQASVVTDPGSYGYLAETAAQAANTVTQVKKQLDILEEARETIAKVNSALRELILIDDIIQSQAYVIKYSQDSYRRFEQSKAFTPGELANILITFNNIVVMSSQNIKIANAVSQDKLLKMNDAERLNRLEKVSQDLRSLANDILIMESRFNTIMQKKILQKAFGKN
jgi:uncharacterized membrane protein YdfJ with MMPL/SSD domain